MNRCFYCDSIINPTDQNMHHKLGVLCASCVAKGRWERMENVKTSEELQQFKINELGL